MLLALAMAEILRVTFYVKISETIYSSDSRDNIMTSSSESFTELKYLQHCLFLIEYLPSNGFSDYYWLATLWDRYTQTDRQINQGYYIY